MGVMSGSVEWVVVKLGSRRVFGDGCDNCSLNARGRGRMSRRSHGVELGCEDVDDVCGIAVVVREVYVDVYIAVVLGIG